MSIADTARAVGEIMEIASEATGLAMTLAQMIASGEVKRVDEILSPQARVQITHELKEAKARAKFGPRP